MSTKRVFLDTNVIIECFRIGAWGQLSNSMRLETVEECCSEALTGETSRAERVDVDAGMLRIGLASIHRVTRRELNELLAKHVQMGALDEGEKQLFAHLFAHEMASTHRVALSTADKGALVRAQDLGWLDSLVSLETLLSEVGAPRPKMALLAHAYSTKFLDDVRIKIRLGIIP